jgi:Domain of unknown function (DUF4326)
MPCTPFKNSNGAVTGFICSRSKPSTAKCVGCGGRAGGFLCDFPATKASGACDARLCAKCSLHFGWRWTPMGNGLDLHDSYDFCPKHRPFVFEQKQRLIWVVSSRTSGEIGELIDRTTPLGNPYKLGDEDSPAAREAVLAQYRQWLWAEMKSDSAANRELDRLQTLWRETGLLMLRCWCTPKACHGQVVASALSWRARVDANW